KVDDVTVMLLCGALVHFLAADVREDHLPIVCTLGDEPIHFAKWGCRTSCVGIVKRKANADNDAPLKALCSIGGEAHRVVRAAAVEQEGGNRIDFAIVELPLTHEGPFRQVDNAHDYRGETWPLVTLPRD